MRQGRYRFQMIEEEKLQRWAKPLSIIFETWSDEWKKGQLKSWEFVARYLLIFVFLNRPHEKWSWGKGHQKGLPKDLLLNQQVQSALTEVLPPDHLNKWELCSLWLQGDWSFLRGVPDKVLRSLCGWRDGKFHLFLLDHIPSAQELLSFQVKGQRCVTVLLKSEEIMRPAETGRDVWSFCLHDLLHASHFFADPKQNLSQRYLAKFFLRAWQQFPICEWLKSDAQFAADFTYVAADMNAHPVYIFLSFQAKILEAFKRQKGLELTARLSKGDEFEWILLWEQLLIDIIEDSESARKISLLNHNLGIDSGLIRSQINQFLFEKGTALSAVNLSNGSLICGEDNHFLDIDMVRAR